MTDYAFFISSNKKYLPYLNALLNSFQKNNIKYDVHIVYFDFDDNHPYLKNVLSSFDYSVYLHKAKEKHFKKELEAYSNIHKCKMPDVAFIQALRWKYLPEIASSYKSIAVVDADMFVTSGNIINFFDLVAGTEKIIGSDEKFKWHIPPRYTLNKNIIFEETTRLMKYACLVPLFFSMSKWTKVFETMYECLFYGQEIYDNEDKFINDTFAFNIAAKKHNRDKDIILFPSQFFTQVHNTAFQPWFRIRYENGYWITEMNEEVYLIHGRIDDKKYESMVVSAMSTFFDQQGFSAEGKEQQIKEVRYTVRMLQREWYNLNFCQRLKLSDYMEGSRWQHLK